MSKYARGHSSMQPIPFFPGYFVTEDGRVWSLVKCKDKGRWLSLHKTRLGYIRVWIKHPVLGCIQMYVHRLVAITYIPNPLGLPEVNHKKGVKSDNRVSQLEWVSRERNIEHKVEMALVARGEGHYRAKLNEPKVRKIRRLLETGTPSYICAEIYDVSQQTIADIKFRRSWRHLDV